MTKNQKIRCYFYALFAFSALILCWQQNLYYVGHGPIGAFIAFGKDLLANAASRSISIDIVFGLLLLLVSLSHSFLLPEKEDFLNIKNLQESNTSVNFPNNR